ncbi:TIGR03905 family TSCPD domain-containing protein [Parabacteroides sp. OttesenSCG-928-N08]|nr:TIGR03905 family TSCPD domain-containing protein [Parabacteroides sp. OttesenSCG-928-N08]
MNKEIKEYIYIPEGGVCSQRMVIQTEGTIIRDVRVEKGCHGNSQGVVALLRGMEIDEAIRRLKGITCRRLSTSCPDQLAEALSRMKQEG